MKSKSFLTLHIQQRYSCERTSKTDTEEKKLLNKVIIFVFFARKKYSRSFITLQLNHMDVTWTILTMSLLPFWALNVSVALLSMEGQKALGFHLNLCSEDERRSYGCGTSWAWVINDIIFIFGWTVTLMYEESWTNSVQYIKSSYHSRFFFLIPIHFWHFMLNKLPVSSCIMTNMNKTMIYSILLLYYFKMSTTLPLFIWWKL